MPQNHPNPKEAVSNLKGAAASMFGRLVGFFSAAAVVAPLASAGPAASGTVNTAIMSMDSIFIYVLCLKLVFMGFILMIMSIVTTILRLF
jgi:hypothetical protein